MVVGQHRPSESFAESTVTTESCIGPDGCSFETYPSSNCLMLLSNAAVQHRIYCHSGARVIRRLHFPMAGTYIGSCPDSSKTLASFLDIIKSIMTT